MRKHLEAFSTQKGFELRFRPVQNLNTRELCVEKNYWKRFYKLFCEYLYDKTGCFDNYAGSQIKIIRAFFNYLNREMIVGVGEFHRNFYVRRESIPIFPLTPSELNFLICNKEFETELSPKLREVKDLFVFGCTVALRVSDLLSLRISNIRIVDGQHYLAVRSVKTSTYTLVKLPVYAIDIVARYTKGDLILPAFSSCKLNRCIKQLLEKAGMTHPVQILREKQGRPIAQIPFCGKKAIFRFCDIASSHTMRRTAITTMLSLGMKEQVVRRISGHSPGSKEFYRYVFWAQQYQDAESDNFFHRLMENR